MTNFLESVAPIVPEPGGFHSTRSSVIVRSAFAEELDELRDQVDSLNEEVRRFFGLEIQGILLNMPSFEQKSRLKEQLSTQVAEASAMRSLSPSMSTDFAVSLHVQMASFFLLNCPCS